MKINQWEQRVCVDIGRSTSQAAVVAPPVSGDRQNDQRGTTRDDIGVEML